MCVPTGKQLGRRSSWRGRVTYGSQSRDAYAVLVTRFDFEPEQLGSGGFGRVHAARRVDEHGTPVADGLAIKFLKDEWCANADAVARFGREVRLQQAELSHPNVLPIVARNLSAEPPYFVMPKASHSLRDEINDGLTDDLARALALFESVLEGMAHAHERSVLHRDLKPENVLFIDGVPQVADFGLGKRIAPGTTELTQTGTWFGTEAYMAPEQRSATKLVTKAADVYSLGKMLAELLTGHDPQPFVFRAAEVPPEYRYFLSRCCDQDADARYQDAGEVLAAFRMLHASEVVIDPPMAGAERLIQAWMLGNGDIDAIAAHFARYEAEEELYSELVPELPEGLVAELLTNRPTDARQLFFVYDRHIDGSLPFNYCDTVAGFYARVFDSTDDVEIKRVIAARLWELGPRHNRWHVGSVLARMVARVNDRSDEMVLVEAITNAPRYAEWNARYFAEVEVPGLIGRALKEAID